VVTIDDVRSVAETLPRSYEAFVQGRVKFRVGRIVYLAFSRDETLLGFAFPKEWRDALVENEPEKFMLPRASDLRYNWAVVRLAAVDEVELRGCTLDGIAGLERLRGAAMPWADVVGNAGLLAAALGIRVLDAGE